MITLTPKILGTVLLVSATTLPLKHCHGPETTKQPVTISDSCQVIKKTLYSDGKFQFSDAEIDALSEENQVKLDSVKRFYRANCSRK